MVFVEEESGSLGRDFFLLWSTLVMIINEKWNERNE